MSTWSQPSHGVYQRIILDRLVPGLSIRVQVLVQEEPDSYSFSITLVKGNTAVAYSRGYIDRLKQVEAFRVLTATARAMLLAEKCEAELREMDDEVRPKTKRRRKKKNRRPKRRAGA